MRAANHPDDEKAIDEAGDMRHPAAEIAERLGAVVVRHEKNFGYGAALHSLFKRANELNADLLITLDSDGQHDPAEVPTLIQPIEDGLADVVLGSRFLDKHGTADMPTYRQLGVKVITKLSNVSHKNGVSDAQSGFRAYSKNTVAHLQGISENGMSASIELLRTINKSKLKLCEVPISCKYSGSIGVKTSTKNPLTHGVELVMSLVKLIVEERPIKFLGIPGILSLVLGTLFGVWMLNLYSIEHHIVTNIALGSIAFLFLGFFMISTSITLYAISRMSTKLGLKE